MHAFTSVVSNYIPKARVLASSIKKLHPELVFHLVLSDTPPPGFQIETEPFDSLILVTDLGIQNVESWIFQHTLVEVSTAVKGPALRKILALPDCSAAFYFDPDIVVLSKLDGLISEFDGASVLLTPHLTAPETTLEAILDNEFSVLRHGIYNLGFVGVKNSTEGNAFAAWWSDRLLDYCFDDMPRGIFTDQRWVDIAPAAFAGIRILRSPVYNVATWNLTHRHVAGSLQDGLTVNDQPIVFYHFSGFDSGAQEEMLKKYGSSMPALFEFRRWYIEESDRMGQAEFAPIPWAYGVYDNGDAITRQQRVLYREREDLRNAFPNPFDTSDPAVSYWHWYRANAQAERRIALDRTTGFRRRWDDRPREASYRIFLFCGQETPAAVAESLRTLRLHSWRSDSITLVGGPEDPELSPEDAFARVLLRFPEQDFIFARAGLLFPDLWDLRLHWSAIRRPGVATVSPLCDSDDLTSLDPDRQWLNSNPAEQSYETVDRLCHMHSEFLNPELPVFLGSCVYVRSEAAKAFRPSAGRAQDRSGRVHDRFIGATRASRFSHILADHVFVASQPDAGEMAGFSFQADVRKSDPRLSCTLALNDLRRSVRVAAEASAVAPFIAERVVPRQLHIMHSWGGGLNHWVHEYCAADDAHDNLVLKSVGTWGAFGAQLSLFRCGADTEPIETWHLSPSIPGTAEAHAGYRAILESILDRFGIDRILVSSLVGHSLDALRTELPTALVCHDYYPFCPALNITFEGLCRQCTPSDLARCTDSNPHHRFFLNLPPESWLRLREAFRKTVVEGGIILVAPSPSVRDNFRRFFPDFEDLFRVIPHGTSPLKPSQPYIPDEKNRLKIVILGSIAPQKGQFLLKKMLPELTSFADIYLLGAGEEGMIFADSPGVSYLKEYALADLPGILADIRPHAGLLLSLVPETFSYTLQEMFELAVPPVATRIGSFADRIRDGENGFLCEPTAESVLACLRRLDGDRASLRAIAERLRQTPVRRVTEMLQEYDAVLGTSSVSPRAYFSRDAGPRPLPFVSGSEPLSAQAQLYWKTNGKGFREADSTTVAYPCVRVRQKISLPIPPLDGAISQLRFDPASCSGLVMFCGLRLLDGVGGEIWKFELGDSLFADGRAAQMLLLGPGSETGIQTIYLTGNDPALVLEVPPQAFGSLSSGGSLEWEFAWMGAGRAIPPLGAQSRPRPLDTASRVQMENLIQELAAARARIEDLQQSGSWRVTLPLRKLLDLYYALVGPPR
jgi:glycosyltransferase involved in cell wall biosynthesis